MPSMRSLHGWKHWATEWLGWITKTWRNYRTLLVDVTDVAEMQTSENQSTDNVNDVITAPDLTKLSRSWCEHDTLALESVYYTIILRAAPVVVLESCERYFDSVCLNMFGLTQRVHIPSLKTAQHAALAHLAATGPSKLDSREGCLHWWRVLPENFKLNSGSMSKDMRVLMRKNLQQLSCFDSCWYWSVLCRIHESSIPRIFPSCPTNSCVATWSWLS